MRRRTTRSTRTDTLFPSTTLFRSAPWLRLTAAGYDPVIATPRGGEAPIDPASRSEAFISDAGRGFLADPAAVAALAATLTVDSIDPDSLVGMLLDGGAGGVWDLDRKGVG